MTNDREGAKFLRVATVETNPCVSHVAAVHGEAKEGRALRFIMRNIDPSAEVAAMSQGEDVLFLDSDCQKRIDGKARNRMIGVQHVYLSKRASSVKEAIITRFAHAHAACTHSFQYFQF